MPRQVSRRGVLPNLGSSLSRSNIVNTIISEGKRQGASGKQIKAALEAGIVESNLKNLNYGDRDSKGVFQQRPSQGWRNPRNVRVAASQFFQHAKSADKGQPSGALAQDVQRSAFPGK